MSRRVELCDSVKNIVAKLYVLRDSCTGIMHTEKSLLIWFQGAEALLQEAVEELEEALRTLEELLSIAETEEEDLAYVERLIKKLDKFYSTRISVDLETEWGPA